MKQPTHRGRPLQLTALYSYTGPQRRLRSIRPPPRLARWRVVCRRDTGHDRTLRIAIRCSLQAAVELAMEELTACGWPAASIELYPIPEAGPPTNHPGAPS